MASWDKISPRAVVPTPSLLRSRDIISASTDLALDSPSSFGLGISLVSPANPHERIPLQLFYVSPSAASDRSPSSSPLNAPGVKAGWYVIAEPGAQFEVFVSALNGAQSVAKTTPLGDMIVALLYVDGSVADSGGDVYPRHSAAGYSDASYPGFVESFSCDPVTGSRHITYRRFIFFKTPTTEDIKLGKNSDMGSIRLALAASKKGQDAPLTRKRTANVLQQGDGVNEKDAIKNGVSIGVRRDGERFTKQTVACNYSECSSESLPGSSVTIFMRERFWLVSRNIINGKGNPVKYREKVVSSEVLSVSGSDDEAGDVVDIDQEDLNCKRNGEDLESAALKKKKFDPGEVIVIS